MDMAGNKYSRVVYVVKANVLDSIQEPIRTGIDFLGYIRNYYLNNFFTTILRIGLQQVTFERIDWT